MLLVVETGVSLRSLVWCLPTECAEDEVHDEECSEEDEGAEVEPGPGRPGGVLHLNPQH